MAKFALKAGGVIDVVSGDEMQEQIDRVVKMLGRSQRPPNSLEHRTVVTTDASGNMPSGGTGVGGPFVDLYRVPVGMIAVVHRIHLEAAGKTPAAPSTSGWIHIATDIPNYDHVFDIFPQDPATSETVAPWTITYSVSAAKILKSGQKVIAYGQSLEHSTAYYFNSQILLWETEG